MGSKSSSSSSSATTDNRTVADAGAIAVVGSAGSTVNVTDGGLIDAGLEYLGNADKANTDRLSLLIQAGGGLIEAQNQHTQTLLEAKQAQESGGLTPANMTLAILAGAVGLVVLGVMK